jgi:hypothetical protein
MTITQSPSLTTPAADTDVSHLPGPRVHRALLVTGGVLFAVGNLLHPLDHSDAAARSPLWSTAHLVFAAGGLLAAAGLAPVARLLRASRLGLAGLALMWWGLVLLPVSSAFEVWVAPAVGMERTEEISGAPLLVVVSAVPFLLGPVLVAIAALRRRLLPVPVSVGLLLFTVGAVVAGGLPHELQGLGIIPGSVALGAALAGAGIVTTRRSV